MEDEIAAATADQTSRHSADEVTGSSLDDAQRPP
jgi:hypothetical protein